jgi:hypothetical protein
MPCRSDSFGSSPPEIVRHTFPAIPDHSEIHTKALRQALAEWNQANVFVGPFRAFGELDPPARTWVLGRAHELTLGPPVRGVFLPPSPAGSELKPSWWRRLLGLVAARA